VEGKYDTGSATTPAYDLPLLYHIGGNRFYKQTSVTKSFSVCCENDTRLKLTLDVKKIFYGSVDTIDILTENFEQSEDKSTGSVKFANNFCNSFSIQ
jgi:hypothetical protein